MKTNLCTYAPGDEVQVHDKLSRWTNAVVGSGNDQQGYQMNYPTAQGFIPGFRWWPLNQIRKAK